MSGRPPRKPVAGRRPNVGFALKRAAPGVERVVHDQALAQQFMVVGDNGFQSLRYREQPWGLRREIGTRRVGAAHNRGQLRKGGVICEIVLGEKSVEAAEVADM